MTLLRRIAERRIRSCFAGLSAGDPQPLLRLYADDVAFRYLGDHTLAIEARGRAQVEDWMAGMLLALGGPRFEVESIQVAGHPWRFLVASVYTVHACTATRRMRARGLQVAEVRMGRITAETIAPDGAALARFLA